VAGLLLDEQRRFDLCSPTLQNFGRWQAPSLNLVLEAAKQGVFSAFDARVAFVGRMEVDA
jgi:hypothetical protein